MARHTELAGPQLNREIRLAQTACDVLPVDWRNFFFSYFYAYFWAFRAMLHAGHGGSVT